MHTLLSFGEALIDFIPTDNTASQYLPLPGGAPANVAVAYSKLGGSSFFAGGLSKDDLGQKLSHDLTQFGVKQDFVELRDESTALVLVTLDSDGERSFNFYRENTADTQYSLDTLKRIDWREMDIMHFCSNTLTTELMYQHTEYALKKAKESNTLISFDVNVRAQLWQDMTQLTERVEVAAQYANLIKVSKEEAEYLADLSDTPYPTYLQKLLALGPKLIIVTDGPNEIKLLSSDFQAETKVPTIKAVDTTAAGDSFIAGFLKAISDLTSLDETSLLEGISTEKLAINAAKFGAQCGALTSQAKGAFASLPTAELVSGNATSL